MTLTLTLEPSEVQALFDLMGETPAKNGFWPLMVKVKQQVEEQQRQLLPKE